MEKGISFIYWCSFVLAFVAIILSFAFDFTWKTSSAFVGVMFLMLMFNSLIIANKEKNPIIRKHYKFMTILMSMITVILFLSFILQHNLIIFNMLFFMFLILALVCMFEMILYSSMIRYACYYDILNDYAKIMRRKWNNEHRNYQI